jgi:hypothetical protein
LLHECKQVVDYNLEGKQEVAQRTNQWVEDAECGSCWEYILANGKPQSSELAKHIASGASHGGEGDLLKPKSATSVSAMVLISVRRVVRAACKVPASRRASLPAGERALTEAVAVLTALTIWATSDVTALAAALLSLALEETLMVDSVDSREKVSTGSGRDISRGYAY